MTNKLLLSLSLLALTSPAFAASQEPAGSAQASAQEMNMAEAKNESEYRTHLMALGSLSLSASKIAEDKAGKDQVKEFASFEVAEQTAVASVLKDMDTAMPPMAAKDKAVLDKLESAKGAEFDKAYLEASLDTHNKLQELNENYLKTKAAGAAEKHAHHLATVMLPTIKQHVAQSKELMGMIK